jgi:hypothetical protein
MLCKQTAISLRRKQSSGMWYRVDVVLADVSEERIASIFRVEGKIRKSANEEISNLSSYSVK